MRGPRRSVLGGRFELEQELGRGGMGVVYRARDLELDRPVALKVVRKELADADGLARFVREAQLTAALRHPGIVGVHSVGQVDGVPFIAYELVEGARPLDAALASLDRPARVALIRDVARALGHAHARGVVHRDVKPSNVLVDAAGRARVADFGLATAGDVERLTRTGDVLGTPSHMAPEQLDGRRDVGPPADVWAVGVLLYQALTGAAPFHGGSLLQLAARVLEGAPPPPPRALDPTVSAALEAVCLRALRRAPGERFADGEALAAALDAALASGAGPAPRVATRVAVGALFGAAAMLALTALGVAALRPPPPPRASAVPVPPAPAPPAPEPEPEPEPVAAAAPFPEDAPHDDDPHAAVEGLAALQRALDARKNGRVHEAVRELERSVALGHRRAAAYLGRMLRDGHGVPADPTRALRLLERAAAQGDDEAAEEAARMLAGADPRRAATLARRAVELDPDDAGAWLLLGELLLHPHNRAYAEAEDAFLEALARAEAGMPEDPLRQGKVLIEGNDGLARARKAQGRRPEERR